MAGTDDRCVRYDPVRRDKHPEEYGANLLDRTARHSLGLDRSILPSKKSCSVRIGKMMIEVFAHEGKRLPGRAPRQSSDIRWNSEVKSKSTKQ